MAEITKPKTLEELKDIVREHEPNMSMKNPHMVTILVFLVMCQIGLDEDKTVEFIGYKGKKEKQIRNILKRMAEVGILITSEDGTKGLRVEWFEKNVEEGSVALTMDAMTVTGEFERTVSSEGIKYGLTKNGKGMAEAALKRIGINPANISREKSK